MARTGLAEDHAKKSPQHSAGIDLLKILAALGVIWVHLPFSGSAARWTILARYAVPFFASCSCFFVVRAHILKPERSFTRYISERASRILLPFLFWTLAYALLRGLIHMMTSGRMLSQSATMGISVLWAGSTRHLWFLPFVFVAGCLMYGIAKIGMTGRIKALCTGVLLLACSLCIVQVNIPATPFLDARTRYLLVQSWGFLPSALAGGALGLFNLRADAQWHVPRFFSLIALLLAIGCLGHMYIHGRARNLENVCGVLLLIAGLCVCNNLHPFLRPLASYGYGVFLVHLFFVDFFSYLGITLHIGGSTGWNLFTFLCAALLSFFATHYLRKSRWTFWTVP